MAIARVLVSVRDTASWLVTAIPAALFWTSIQAMPAGAGVKNSRMTMPHGLSGISAIEVDREGRSATLISDRGHIYSLDLQRAADGSTSSLAVRSVNSLRGADGAPLPRLQSDAEGLAEISPGRFAISFEQDHRIDIHTADGNWVGALTRPAETRESPKNRGIEAIAALEQGRLWWCVEETSACFLFEGDRSRLIYDASLDDGYHVTGADAHPDGGIVILERRVSLLGFSARLRHLKPLAGGGFSSATLHNWAWGEAGNLEGVSLWRDGAGRLRAVLVEDNNFSALQGNRLHEIILDEKAGP